eukprot:gene26571-32623_t
MAPQEDMVSKGLRKASNAVSKMAGGMLDSAGGLVADGGGKDVFVMQKSLRDIIKGIRTAKDEENAYTNEVLYEIQKEIRTNDPRTKAIALQKLTYLNMFGHSMGWAAFHTVEVMSQDRLSLKHAGYLAAKQSFQDSTEVMVLIPNLLKKDLASSVVFEVGFALDCLANIITPDLARDLVSDVFSLLNSSRAYLRKKAVLVLYKAFLRYPESLRPAFGRLTEKLEDDETSVISSVVAVLCELVIHNPKNYLPLAPTFYKLLQTSTNNWMTIKLVKIFGHMCPLEPRLAKKLVEPITQIMSTTPAKSLLYECICTVTNGMTHINAVCKLAAEKLKDFIVEFDPNLKFLGLRALTKLLPTHPKAVADHKETIFACLQ